jgi:hypothetical protein
MTDKEASGSRFIVDLGNIKLPPLVEKQVEAEIKAVVLRALAERDAGDHQRERRDRISLPIRDQFPGQTLGMWIGPEDEPPTITYPQDDTEG